MSGLVFFSDQLMEDGGLSLPVEVIIYQTLCEQPFAVGRQVVEMNESNIGINFVGGNQYFK
jgi:hypothetical protein